MPRTEIVQSLSRGLQLLELMADESDGESLVALAQRLGVSRSTAHNLLRTLAAHDFVEKTRDPVRYRLGSAVRRLAGRSSRRDWVGRAEEVLQRLYGDLPSATVTVAAYIGGEVCVVLRISPEGRGALERPEGRHLHPYGSASALAFHAYWGADERAEFRQRYPFWEYGAQLWRQSERFENALRMVRRLGCAEPPKAGTDTFRVAAPILGDANRIIATIGASRAGPVEAAERSKIIEYVGTAASELTAEVKG